MVERYFKYSFEPGQKLNYKVSVDGRVTVDFQDRQISNLVDVTMIISQTVISKDSNSALLHMAIEDVSSGRDIPKEQLPIKGTKAALRSDELGNVSWVDKANWPGAENSIVTFPNEPLKPGSTWMLKLQNSGSSIAFFACYKLKKYDKKNANIALFTNEVYDSNPESANSKVTGQGTFGFDIINNRISFSKNRIFFSYDSPAPYDNSLSMNTKTNLEVELELV